MKIRPATIDDSAALARIAYIAGQGHVTTSIYDLTFSGPFGMTEERMAAMAAVLSAGHVSWLHYSHFIVAEVDGRVAAALSGLDYEHNRVRDFLAALRETGWSDGDFAVLRESIVPVTSVEPPHPEGAWRVENVGCFAPYRGRGLVNALLGRILDRGRSSGWSVADIGCFLENVPALRAYEKVGFRVTDRFTDRGFAGIFGCPGMCRLTLRL